MNNEFSIISYNEEDLHLISIAKIHFNIFDMHAGATDPIIQDNETKDPIIQDNETKDPVIQDNETKDPVIQDNETKDPVIQDNETVDIIIQDEEKLDIVQLILKIDNYLSIDILNKEVEYNQVVPLSVIFTEKTTLNDNVVDSYGDIIIDNKHRDIPFQLTIIENNNIRYVMIDTSNYIIDNKGIGGINNIIINSLIHCKFMIINHEFKETVDKLYDIIDNDKITTKIITE